jgi:hypothetical protein
VHEQDKRLLSNHHSASDVLKNLVRTELASSTVPGRAIPVSTLDLEAGLLHASAFTNIKYEHVPLCYNVHILYIWTCLNGVLE